MSATDELWLAHKELQDEVRRLKAENQQLRWELDLAKNLLSTLGHPLILPVQTRRTDEGGGQASPNSRELEK